ncbi:hypothetical protein Hanom_Chr07g00650681 [Helianthus anomalus]
MLVFFWYPNPSMCHDGSIGWTWPLNAIKAGGRVPSFHSVKFDFKFCNNIPYAHC